MPDAFLPLPEDRARRERWAVLAVCGLISLLLHLMPVWLWPGYGGSGLRTTRLHATFRSMPALPLPEAAPAAVAESAHKDARKAASSKDLQGGDPETRTGKASAGDVTEEAGGGRLSEYVPVELLSTRPRFLVDMSEYIPASLETSESGRIVLQVLIGEDGEVDGVVVESTELTPRGTRRFVQRLDALRLQPALQDGRPVKSRWRMEFSFSPQTE